MVHSCVHYRGRIRFLPLSPSFFMYYSISRYVGPKTIMPPHHTPYNFDHVGVPHLFRRYIPSAVSPSVIRLCFKSTPYKPMEIPSIWEGLWSACHMSLASLDVCAIGGKGFKENTLFKFEPSLLEEY